MSVPSIEHEQLDLSLDPATLLRLGTAKAHELAEQSSGAKLLTSGGLSRESYIQFLVVLWHVYSALEDALDAHSSDPIISPTYNPRLLSRTSALSADIAYFLQTPEPEWKDHPLVSSLYYNPPAEVNEYIISIQTAASSDRSRLLAHAYVRYLGDLSGGQIIRRRIRKAYGLTEEEFSGTQFYDFERLEGNGRATIGDMRTVKVWYRDRLNESVGDDANRKAAIVAEANLAFHLNGAILNLLHATNEPSVKEETLSPTPQSAILSGSVASHLNQWTRVQQLVSSIFG